MDRCLDLASLKKIPEEKAQVMVYIDERIGESGHWNKSLTEDACLKTGLEALKGNTFDVTVENRTPYEITDWNISFTINSPCFLESAWCGKVDIFQQRSGSLLVQNLDLRNFNSNFLRVDYVINGEQVLFPLNKGDIFVYYPSLEEKEYPIMGITTERTSTYTKFGFILYGEKNISPEDFLNGTITYKFRKRIFQDPAFKILIFISLVWGFLFLFILLTEGMFGDLDQIELRDKKMIREVMETFSGFVDAKDPYTGGHSIRVGKYSRQLAEEMGLDKKQCQEVFYCGLLHDCGKISIHDDILSKPKRLSDEEFKIIKSHTVRGFEILSGLTAIPEACMVARYHHERYDGKGYPDGLSGDAIPLYARITCLADAFDAMNSNRCYRNHMGPEMIMKQLSENAGKQFDADVVDAMLRLIMRGEIVFYE